MLVGCDARPGIAHLQLPALRARAQRHQHALAGLRELDGVVQQVRQRTPQHQFVGKGVARALVAQQRDHAHPRALGRRAVLHHHRPHQWRQFDRPDAGAQRAGVHARQIQHLGQQLVKRPPRLADAVDGAARLGIALVRHRARQRFEVQADGMHRLAQVVADGGKEARFRQAQLGHGVGGALGALAQHRFARHAPRLHHGGVDDHHPQQRAAQAQHQQHGPRTTHAIEHEAQRHRPDDQRHRHAGARQVAHAPHGDQAGGHGHVQAKQRVQAMFARNVQQKAGAADRQRGLPDVAAINGAPARFGQQLEVGPPNAPETPGAGACDQREPQHGLPPRQHRQKQQRAQQLAGPDQYVQLHRLRRAPVFGRRQQQAHAVSGLYCAAWVRLDTLSSRKMSDM